MVTLIIEKIVMMFLILMLGVLCYKKNFLDDGTSVNLSNFLLMIVNPLVIFVSYQIPFDEARFHNLLLTLLLSLVAFAVQIVLIHLIIPGRKNGNAAIERLSAIYGNCGFIGIPLINSLFGREGVFYMTAYLTVFYLYFWTHGVIIMAGKSDLKSTLKNLLSPAIVGVVLGLICFLAQIRLPDVIVSAMDSVGSMNTPLAMLVAGATLGKSDLKVCLRNKRIYWICFLKLILVPAAAMLMLLPLHLTSTVVMTLLVACACPIGACCTMFSLKFKGDGRYASEMFAVSTVLSAVTIPFLVFFTEQLGIL